MTEEENKAIEAIKRTINISKDEKKLTSKIFIDDEELLLNLIEKQQKEIEERENRYWKREERFLGMFNREKEKHEEIYNELLDERDENYIPKGKIREQIKECEKELDELHEEQETEETIFNVHVLSCMIPILEELLEEE